MVEPATDTGKAREAGPSPRLILDSINAYQRSSALKAAVTLDVFSAIAAGAATPAALAAASGADARALRILCDYLVVAGFLVKDAPSERLSRAIRDVHAGRRVIDVDLATSTTVTAPAGSPVAAGAVAGPLSSRERGILSALRDGIPLSALRSVLGLSSATLQAHLVAAQGKTGSRSSTEAARVAYDNGWL